MRYLSLPFALIILLCSFAFNGFQAQTKIPVAIGADKMNVLYIGVQNPITVAMSGIPIESTKVSIDKGSITPTDKVGKYNVCVLEVGQATIQLEGRNKQGNVVRSNHSFRVKRIPNPTARLSNKSGGKISLDFMKAQRGIIAHLLNLDINASWKILHYTIERIQKNEHSVILEGFKGRFSSEVKALLEESQSEDIYHFYDIKIKGPDGLEREIQGMDFKIK